MRYLFVLVLAGCVNGPLPDETTIVAASDLGLPAGAHCTQTSECQTGYSCQVVCEEGHECELEYRECVIDTPVGLDN